MEEIPLGLFRVARRSIVSASRSRKRLFVFVTIFTILAAATLFSVAVFEEYSKEKLLNQKGVVIKSDTLNSVSFTAATDLLDEIEDQADDSLSQGFIYSHFEANLDFRVLCIYVDSPWAFKYLKPSDIETGRFPKRPFETLIASDAKAYLGNQNISLDIGVMIYSGTGADALSFPVVGTFDNSDNKLNPLVGTQQWLVIGISNDDDRVTVRKAFGLADDTNVFVYEMTLLAKGSPVSYNPLDWASTKAYNNVEEIAAVITANYQNPIYGQWESEIEYSPSSEKTGERTADVTRFIFGIFGGILVATLYAYLITRFRRREVAILKAIGYNKTQVRISLLSEILAVALGGFLIGYGLVVIGKFAVGGSIGLISLETTLISLATVVLINIPGFLIVSWRILSVRPMELFRDR